jgi:hypothetical protein
LLEVGLLGFIEEGGVGFILDGDGFELGEEHGDFLAGGFVFVTDFVVSIVTDLYDILLES